MSKDKSEWFSAQYNGGLLGEKFAFARMGIVGLRGAGGGTLLALYARSDLQNLRSLSKIRAQQWEELTCSLKSILKEKRAMIMMDFFKTQEKRTTPKEVVALNSDYEFHI